MSTIAPVGAYNDFPLLNLRVPPFFITVQLREKIL